MSSNCSRSISSVSLAVALTLSVAAASASTKDGRDPRKLPASVKSVEFIGMDAPATVQQRATVYSDASVNVTYRNGRTRSYPLTFRELHDTMSSFNGVTVGDLYDQYGNVLLDPAGEPQRSETPDANSLIKVQGARSDDPHKRRLFLVTHQEYDWIDTMGNDNYGKQPMTMNLATIDQDKRTGMLSTVAVKNVDFSGIRGLWIPCAGSLSPWNTHLGSQEYEPDGRCAENPGKFCASTPSYPTWDDSDNYLNLNSMNRYLDPSGTTKPARVYDYGIVPEVSVDRYGNAAVEAHRALGRISRELVQVMPDSRTVYQGDDGTYNVMTMFVADVPRNLSAGTLYAAKWIQASPETEEGGRATLKWIRLGHADDRYLDRLVDNGIKFSDIFDVREGVTDKETCESEPGYRFIKAGHSVGLAECLKLASPGKARAAAFLETRRFAAYMGATVEFEKFEGVTVNASDSKLYVAMTRMRNGMQSSSTDPVDDIRIPRNDAGAVYEIELRPWQVDTNGWPIQSRYVGIAMHTLVSGQSIPADEYGNTADVDSIASPDNIKYSGKLRTLFIGEDSGLHVNNFLWAYSIDTGKLSRILSLPAGAESTGLQVVENVNGSAYIMSNYQHAGDFTSATAPELKDALRPLIDPYKAAVGYLEGLPGLN